MKSQLLNRPMTIPITLDLYERLRKLAYEKNKTMSRLVREAIYNTYWAGEYFLEENAL